MGSARVRRAFARSFRTVLSLAVTSSSEAVRSIGSCGTAAPRFALRPDAVWDFVPVCGSLGAYRTKPRWTVRRSMRRE